MSKVMVVLADGFEEIEALAVVDILRRAEIDTDTVALKAGLVTSARNIRIEADRLISDVNQEDYEMIVLPGGGVGAKNIGDSEAVLNIVKQYLAAPEKFVAAICATPFVLAEKGVIKDVMATCYPSMAEAFAKYCDYQLAEVVVDENLITSRGPATAAEFAFTLVELLKDEETARRLREGMLYA